MNNDYKKCLSCGRFVNRDRWTDPNQFTVRESTGTAHGEYEIRTPRYPLCHDCQGEFV